MSITTSNEYYENKKALFRQCLNLSEELISSIEDWESVPDIVTRREEVISQLKELEETTDKITASSLSMDRKKELDQMLKLILDLDKDATKLIRKEQQNIMSSLKTNTQGQKLMQYASTPGLIHGRIMDYKK